MLPAAKEEMLCPLAPSSAWSNENIFSFAPGVALFALGTRRGARAALGKKPHQGVFSNNPALRSGEIRAKWSRTHRDSETWWQKTASGSALDANGNSLADASGKQYSWNFENQLASATVPNVGTTTFFKQLGTQSFDLRRTSGLGQAMAKKIDQVVGGPVQKEPKGVGQKAVTAQAVSAKAVLEFLDAVLAFAAIVVEGKDLCGATGAAGYEEAEVGASGGMFGFVADATLMRPTVGTMVEAGETALWHLGATIAFL